MVANEFSILEKVNFEPIGRVLKREFGLNFIEKMQVNSLVRKMHKNPIEKDKNYTVMIDKQEQV